MGDGPWAVVVWSRGWLEVGKLPMPSFEALLIMLAPAIECRLERREVWRGRGLSSASADTT